MNQLQTASLQSELARVPALSDADKEVLTAAVERLSSAADPLKIILFGSRARGQARLTSDFDLLVIVPKSDHLAAQWNAMLRAVRDFRPSIDVLVTSDEEFAWRSQVIFFVQYYAQRDGYVVYERL